MDKNFPVNDEIRANQVHLIMTDGRSAGTVSLDQAKQQAEEAGLDLVAISPRATPPVVRILDYNKYRYQLEKNARGGVKPKANQLKEIRLSFAISAHDLETKAKRAREFLDQGYFIRVFINLRGRENIFPEKAKQNLLDFTRQVEAEIEQSVNQAGKRIQLIIKPGKHAQAKNS